MKSTSKKSSQIDATVSKSGSKSKKSTRSRATDRDKYPDDLDRKSQAKGSKFAGVTTNDPSWYINNPALSRDVGNILFSRPTGEKLYPAYPVTTFKSDAEKDPGIMVLSTQCTWGGSGILASNSISNAGTPINLTATKLYQYVVHANSRNVSYDKKDLIMTMMAIDGVWQHIADGIRAYRLIAQYDVTNKFMNKLITALGWDVENLRSNVAQFRFYINYAITRINKFFVPDLFDMWKAHTAAYSNVYLDSPNTKAQYIAKIPLGFWLYNDVEGALEYKKAVDKNGVSASYVHDPGALKVEDFQFFADLMISRIEDSQYIGIIQGDLLKAFGFEHMAQFQCIDIDMPFFPVYDEEFLIKLHNADICYMGDTYVVGNDRSWAIYRDTDIVDGNIQYIEKQQHANSMGLSDCGKDVFGTTYVDIPDGIPADPSVVLLMCLYKQFPRVDATTKWYLSDESTATYCVLDLMPERIVRARIHIDPERISSVVEFQTGMHYYGSALSASNVQKGLKLLSYIDKFKKHPAVNVEILHGSGPSQVSDAAMPFWEIDNVAEISPDQLVNICRVINWSLWSSSVIASSTGV